MFYYLPFFLFSFSFSVVVAAAGSLLIFYRMLSPLVSRGWINDWRCSGCVVRACFGNLLYFKYIFLINLKCNAVSGEGGREIGCELHCAGVCTVLSVHSSRVQYVELMRCDDEMIIMFDTVEWCLKKCCSSDTTDDKNRAKDSHRFTYQNDGVGMQCCCC